MRFSFDLESSIPFYFLIFSFILISCTSSRTSSTTLRAVASLCTPPKRTWTLLTTPTASHFMGVHDAAHSNLGRWCVTAVPSHPCSTCKYYELSCACICAELAEQEHQEGCPQQFGCRDMQYVDLPGTSRLDTDDVETDDPQWFCAREL